MVYAEDLELEGGELFACFAFYDEGEYFFEEAFFVFCEGDFFYFAEWLLLGKVDEF